MSDPSVLSVALDPDLRDRFLAAAARAKRPAAEVLHDLVRAFVDRDAAGQSDWFEDEPTGVLRGAPLAEAEHGSGDDMLADWDRERMRLAGEFMP